MWLEFLEFVQYPYVATLDLCGSSTGSTISVATLGTKTYGSLLCRPSSTNSVVGIKPTIGLIFHLASLTIFPYVKLW
ncbi:putative amidase signature domain-containing protein [Helianthus anomalus]